MVNCFLRKRSGIHRHMQIFFCAVMVLFPSVMAPCQEFPGLKTVSLASAKLSWGIALTGKVLSPPLLTGDGYAAVSEGNIITVFNNDGKIIWKKEFEEEICPLLSNGHGGMLYLISPGGKLLMLRSGGSVVWKSDAGFEITKEAFAAKDGRVYAFGDDKAACFGIKGIRRWTLDLPGISRSLYPVELDDGTLVIFMEKKDEDGNTVMVTVSPFGEKGFYYSLPGTVSDARTTPYGAVIGFADGSSVLMRGSCGTVYYDWMTDTGTKSPVKIFYDPVSGSTLILSGKKALNVDAATGKTVSEFSIFCGTESAGYISINAMGLVTADSSYAVCYTFSGEPEWISKLNQKRKWDYVSASDDGHLFFCTKNWLIESYRVKQIPSLYGFSFDPPPSGDYSALYDKMDPNTGRNAYKGLFTADQISCVKKAFSEGDFSGSEKKWLSMLTDEIGAVEGAWFQSISQTQTEKSYLSSDMDYVSKILDLASESGTGLFQKNIASLIHGTTDARRMEILVKTAGKTAFDPDFLMLSEMEKIVLKYNGADTILTMICDAAVEICSFMGRRAFDAKGRSILTAMINSRYSVQVRTAAMESLEKLRKILSEQ